MRFASLGSGSRGNSTVVQAGDCCLLIDCGFTVNDTVARLARLGLEPEAINAVLVTHEHSDHLGSASPFVRKFGCEFYMTAGTFRAAKKLSVTPTFLNPHVSFDIAGITVHPFPVPHDAQEPCQFVLQHEQTRLGILSDLGHHTPHVIAALDGCDALMLECNHDYTMLQNGEYPASLKRRVGGHYGHLNNDQAAEIASKVITSKTQHLVLGHLSEQNNEPDIARHAIYNALSELGWLADRIVIATQDLGCEWQMISANA